MAWKLVDLLSARSYVIVGLGRCVRQFRIEQHSQCCHSDSDSRTATRRQAPTPLSTDVPGRPNSMLVTWDPWTDIGPSPGRLLYAGVNAKHGWQRVVINNSP